MITHPAHQHQGLEINNVPPPPHVSLLSELPKIAVISLEYEIVGRDDGPDSEAYCWPVNTWSIGDTFAEAYRRWERHHHGICPSVVRLLANPKRPQRARHEVADNHTGRVKLIGRAPKNDH